MRGGVLAAALACAALGLALAFAPRRTWMACLPLLAASSLAGLAIAVPPARADVLYPVVWISVIACAAAVHLPRGVPAALGCLLSIDAGSCAGALVSLEGHGRDLPLALCGALALVPAALAVHWRLPIAAKVASSWLIAIAVLAAALPYLPVTPGYLPDHLE